MVYIWDFLGPTTTGSTGPKATDESFFGNDTVRFWKRLRNMQHCDRISLTLQELVQPPTSCCDTEKLLIRLRDTGDTNTGDAASHV